jgi:hypothetical protein
MIGMRWRASVLATLVGSLAVVATGRAADQLVLGDAFILDNPGPEQLRTASATAEERNATATIVGDPTLPGSAGGAILTLMANGASTSSQSFVLPQGFPAEPLYRPRSRTYARSSRNRTLSGPHDSIGSDAFRADMQHRRRRRPGRRPGPPRCRPGSPGPADGGPAAADGMTRPRFRRGMHRLGIVAAGAWVVFITPHLYPGTTPLRGTLLTLIPAVGLYAVVAHVLPWLIAGFVGDDG